MNNLLERMIPYAGNFPYKEVISSAWANFDGAQYIIIASHGYLTYQHAYFPLYPLLIQSIHLLFGITHTTSALLISNLAWVSSMFLWYKIWRRVYPQLSTWKIMLCMNIFPTAFFYHAAYTESLFLLLSAALLYTRLTNRWLWVWCSSFLLGFSRLVGVFAVFFGRSIGPLLGLFAYIGYLWYETGNPLNFISSQAAFKNGRSTHIVLLPQVIWRYLKIFFTARRDMLYGVALLEFIFFMLILGLIVYEGYVSYKNKHIYGFELALFSLASIILPTLTGTFASVPRYALLCFAIYPALARITNKYVFFSIMMLSGVLQISLAVLFLQGYFIS